jgi:hypothetical protein
VVESAAYGEPSGAAPSAWSPRKPLKRQRSEDDVDEDEAERPAKAAARGCSPAEAHAGTGPCDGGRRPDSNAVMRDAFDEPGSGAGAADAPCPEVTLRRLRMRARLRETGCSPASHSEPQGAPGRVTRSAARRMATAARNEAKGRPTLRAGPVTVRFSSIPSFQWYFLQMRVIGHAHALLHDVWVLRS